MKDRTAVLTVDLHHGHLDPEIATLPVPPETAELVLDNAERLVTRARDAGYRIFHITSEYRSPEEVALNPNVEYTSKGAREGKPNHNMKGSPGVELMPQIYDEDADIVATPKKGFSPFLTTDLDYLLSLYDIKRLVIAGVNTNTCVQCTCFECYNRGYQDIVVEDCVRSMYGEEYHQYGLENIDQALGTVLSLDEAFDWLEI